MLLCARLIKAVKMNYALTHLMAVIYKDIAESRIARTKEVVGIGVLEACCTALLLGRQSIAFVLSVLHLMLCSLIPT